MGRAYGLAEVSDLVIGEGVETKPGQIFFGTGTWKPIQTGLYGLLPSPVCGRAIPGARVGRSWRRPDLRRGARAARGFSMRFCRAMLRAGSQPQRTGGAWFRWNLVFVSR